MSQENDLNITRSYRPRRTQSQHLQTEQQSEDQQPQQAQYQQPQQAMNDPDHEKVNTESPKKMRKGMKFWMIFCLVFAVLFTYLSFPYVSNSSSSFLPLGSFFAVFTFMFFVLAKSPKKSPRLFGKEKGLRKGVFVLICVYLASALFITQAASIGKTLRESEGGDAFAIEQQSNNIVATSTPTHTPEPTTTPTPTATAEPLLLQKGSKGEDVKLAQEYLIEIGYLSGKADGEFGSKTKKAVETFQKEYLLDVTGVITAYDMEKLTEAVTWYREAREAIGAKRQEWIASQFSVWNGSHMALEDLIIKRLNDEKSYKHIETTCIDVNDEDKQKEVNKLLKEMGYSRRVEVGDLFIMTEFSAKNAFNGTVKNAAFGIASYADNTIILLGIE